MFNQWLPGILIGGIMIIVGLLVSLWFVPVITCRIAKKEKEAQLQIPRLSDHANKAGFILVIIGSLILFLVVAWHVARETGLIL